jgi:hypothetical protein
MQRPGEASTFRNASVALARRGKLVKRTLAEPPIAIGEQPDVVERAQAFLRLKSQDVRIALDGLGQQRLKVPRVTSFDPFGLVPKVNETSELE